MRPVTRVVRHALVPALGIFVMASAICPFAAGAETGTSPSAIDDAAQRIATAFEEIQKAAETITDVATAVAANKVGQAADKVAAVASTTAAGMRKLTQPGLYDTIYARKSVRDFTDQPVTCEQLAELLRAAMAAPTAMDRRPWRFVVLTGRPAIDDLAKGLRSGGTVAKGQAVVVVCAEAENEQAAALPGMHILDAALASQNLLLAVEAEGLGAVWTAVWPMEAAIAHVRQTLGLPANVVPINVIPVGYPKGEFKPKDKWDPATIHWEKW